MNEVNELDNLIQAYLDQRISEEEMDRLNQILVTSEAAQAYYWELASLHWRLSEQSLYQQGMTLSYIEKNNETEVDGNKELTAISQASMASHQSRRNKRYKSHGRTSSRQRQSQNLWWVATAATFVIGVGLVAILLQQNQTQTPSGASFAIDDVGETLKPYKLGVDFSLPGNTVKRGDQTLPMTTGMDIEPGDQINTQASSSMVQISYQDEMTYFKIEPDSKVIFDQVGRAKHIEMLNGMIHSEVAEQPDGAPMKLVTNHSIATVLGTAFTLRTDKKSSQLEVIEGRVRMTGAGDTPAVVIDAGHFAKFGTNLTMKTGILEEVEPDRNVPSDSRPTLTRLVLVNATTGEEIPGYGNLVDGIEIRLKDVPAKLLSIRADIEPVIVDQVRFHFRKIDRLGQMTGPTSVKGNSIGNKVEKVYPYYVSGDNTDDQDIFPWIAEPGEYLLTATPSIQARKPRRQIYGETVNIRFRIVP